MAIRLGDEAPDFTADTTQGPIRFHEWKGNSWAVVFSHPKDFTPVCTTELGRAAQLKGEFEKRNCKIIGLSVDPVESHRKWEGDIKDVTGHEVNFPMIGDPDRTVAVLYDMIHPNASENFTVRSVFVIGPDNKVKLTLTYPASTGRNFDELLRVIDSLQLTANYSVATPVDWKHGEDVIIVPAVSDEDARKKFPKGFVARKPARDTAAQPVSRASRLLTLAALLSACAPGGSGRAVPHPARYLYVWAGTGHHQAGTNFIAVIDVDPGSASYGKILTATPADSGMMPHHAEYTLPAGRPFFANDFMTGRTVLIDPSTPTSPRLAGTVDSTPGFRQLHSLLRLADTLVVATLQFGDSSRPGNPGGLAEFNAAGRLLRTASSRDSTFPGARIRTYGLVLLPAIDRALSTSSPMDSERTANVIQVWRLSDLTLLHTTRMPGIAGDSIEYYPFEARTLADGRTVFLNTYTCGFYRITGLDRSEPRVELVFSMRQPRRFGCSVPIVAGRFWVMPIAYSHVIVTLDLADPAHPVEVWQLPTDTTFFPHWLAADPGSDRLVVTEQGDGLPRIMMLHLDRSTGRLSWDEHFKEADSTGLGLSFSRAGWPNGITGPAMPHAALFVP